MVNSAAVQTFGYHGRGKQSVASDARRVRVRNGIRPARGPAEESGVRGDIQSCRVTR
jgi:hypothetical protein